MARSAHETARHSHSRPVLAPPGLLGLLALASGVSMLLGGCSSTPEAAATRSAPETSAKFSQASQSSRYAISQDVGPPPGTTLDPSQLKDPIPREEPPSRYGNPVSYKVFGKRYTTLKSAAGFKERGLASWYGTKFHGHRTSSGEPYDMYAMTAAHKSLPLPTYVEVTNLDNGRSAIVRVNDRGPFHKGRVIDLSYAAAVKLGVNTKGVAPVEVRALTGQRTRLASAPGRSPARSQARSPANSPARSASTRADVIELNVPMSDAIAMENNSAPTSLFLQVGAFSSRGNAESLRSRLLAANLPNPSISTGQSARGTFYRLRIGPLSSRSQADALLPMLADVGIHDSRVVEVAMN